MLRVLCLVLAFGWASNALSTKSERGLSLFNLVKFDNDMCTGDKRNGTCYTKEECESRDGKESGTCAEGFGVCCILEIKCGKSSSDNNTYLVEPNPTAGEGCSYEICPSASSICRIRYDFTEHTIAGPVLVSSTWGADNVATAHVKGASGHCTSDSFSVINSGAASSPVICGNNDGQHMVLDSDGKGCQQAVFQISSGTEVRKWEIHVTQYSCNEVENTLAGPKGCLQYFTGNTGYIRSFNFPATSGTDLDTATHLSNQEYNVCIKKNAEKTRACFTPIGTYMTTPKQQTYGISGENVGDDPVKGVTDSLCTSDYLAIPGGAKLSLAAGTSMVTAAEASDVFKICGRVILSTDATSAMMDSMTFCTIKAPFTIKVHFDDGENVIGIAMNMLAAMPAENIGSGSVGFGLVFNQS